MSKKLNLHATKRLGSGTSAVKKLRREGAVPGVIYGAAQDNYTIQVKSKEFENLLHHSAGENVLVNLQIEGAKEADKLAMVQEVQHNPLTGQIMHIDFHAVKEDEEVTAVVQVEIVGEAAGVKHGGLLDHQLHSLEVRCKPADLPGKIEVPVSHLEVGEAVHVGDIKPPGGVEFLLDGEVVIANVQEIKVGVAEEEAPAEEAEAASVEGEEGVEAKEAGEAAPES